jgi:hypothetical protein
MANDHDIYTCGCSECDDKYKNKSQSLKDFSEEELEAEILKRKTDRKKNAEVRKLEQEIKNHQKTIYLLLQRIKEYGK